MILSNHRSKLATAASFVDATDSRYGFSSKDLRKLGGSEVCRVKDLIDTDHEWGERAKDGIEIRGPVSGDRIIIKLYWDSCPLTCTVSTFLILLLFCFQYKKSDSDLNQLICHFYSSTELCYVVYKRKYKSRKK